MNRTSASGAVAAALIILSWVPALAQSAYTWTAGSGDAGSQNESTWGDYCGSSAPTGKQKTTNRLLNLEIAHISSRTATGVPIAGTYIAPTNLALRNEGKFLLPRTNLDSFVKQADWAGVADQIYGGDTEELPYYFSFTEEHRIERGIERTNPELTTGHPSDAPSAWGWPN